MNKEDLEIIPVLNKIDLPSADPERVMLEIEDELAIEATDAIQVSAKTGQGMRELLETLLDRVPVDMLQMHGSESPERIATIRQRFGL